MAIVHCSLFIVQLHKIFGLKPSLFMTNVSVLYNFHVVIEVTAKSLLLTAESNKFLVFYLGVQTMLHSPLLSKMGHLL